MEIELTAPAVQDRRVRRSRAALMHATITLVSERGTADVPISDIAEAANVSRPVVYQHFGDRDTLLLESALDLAARELMPRITDPDHALTSRARALALPRHFADHRAFYRAMLTSSCAFALNRSLSGLLIPVNRQLVLQMFGESLDAQSVEDLATFLTGGAAAFVNTWVVESPDPLDPEEFTDRLIRMLPLAVTALRQSPTTPDTEADR
jgi:AcrR family transcriptional regulator